MDRLIRAIVDTLIPGDEDAPLPAASEVGVSAALTAALDTPEGTAYRHVIACVARELEGAHEFVRATPDRRVAALQAVERDAPLEFRRLVIFALEAYYQAGPVLLAMGWRVQSPQPLGHPVEPLDETLIEPVRARGRLWRDAGP
jgi:hypothetical protein